MKLSPNFDSSEFACKHCGIMNVHPQLINVLQKLRDIHGAITITSGCRCADHNKNIGGSITSKHITTVNQPGRAADCYIELGDLTDSPDARYEQLHAMYELAATLLSFDTEWVTGISLYPDHTIPKVHVDVCNDEVRYWIYKNGEFQYMTRKEFEATVAYFLKEGGE